MPRLYRFRIQMTATLDTTWVVYINNRVVQLQIFIKTKISKMIRVEETLCPSLSCPSYSWGLSVHK